MTTTTPARVPLITRREAHELLAAIRALRAIGRRATDYGWPTPNTAEPDAAYCFGRVAAVAAVAEDGIFDVLNQASSYTPHEAPAADAAIKRLHG